MSIVEWNLPRHLSEHGKVLTPEGISYRIENAFAVYKQKGLDPRLIGSFGRQASMGTDNPSFTRDNGLYRDIDLVVLGGSEYGDIRKLDLEAQNIAAPLGLDSFHGFFIQNGTGVSIQYKGTRLPIDPTIIGKKNARLGGIEVSTFDQNTLFHISALFIGMRFKDKLELLRFGRQLRSADNTLPEELFKPFHQLMDLKRELYPKDRYFAEFQYLYSEHVPAGIRHAVKPFAGRVRNLFL